METNCLNTTDTDLAVCYGHGRCEEITSGELYSSSMAFFRFLVDVIGVGQCGCVNHFIVGTNCRTSVFEETSIYIIAPIVFPPFWFFDLILEVWFSLCDVLSCVDGVRINT